jgi:hypothetical protein
METVCNVRVASGGCTSAGMSCNTSYRLVMAITLMRVRRMDPRSFPIFTPVSRPCFKSGAHAHTRSSGTGTTPLVVGRIAPTDGDETIRHASACGDGGWRERPTFSRRENDVVRRRPRRSVYTMAASYRPGLPMPRNTTG